MLLPDPDTLKTIINSTNELLPVKDYFNWYNIICFIAGIVGIFMRVIRSVLSTSPDQSISILKYYIKNHALTLIFASLSYITIVMIWTFNGIDFFGLYIAQLNFMTIFVGYFAQDIFNEIGKRRFNLIVLCRVQKNLFR
jgi:hypothetical protein